MKTFNRPKTLIMTALLAAFSLSSASLALAEDTTDNAAEMRALESTTTTDKEAWRDSKRIEQYDSEKAMLQKELADTASIDQLRARLGKAGYVVTSINQQSEVDIEYEVVKGNMSFEVSADIDNHMLKNVNVSNNIWRAAETNRAMADAAYKDGNVMYDEEQAGKYSDAKYMGPWDDEKDALEASMPVGKTVSDYQNMLQDKGYKITSINEVEDDNVEFEVVKGNHTFEVQLERDPSTKIVNEVKISKNMWHSEETKKALGQK